MLFQKTEHDTQTTLGVLSGMLFRKIGKNQKKQSVQLFCQKTSEFPVFRLKSWN